MGESPKAEWLVETKKSERTEYEVSVCHSSFAHGFKSWGWFGPEKVKVNGHSLEEAQKRASIIAAAFNENGIEPWPTQ